MFKLIKTIQGIIIIAICLTMVASASAGGGGSSEAKNYVQVHNNWDIKMWARFKCYTNNSWESNDCDYENTTVTIEPGNDHKWKHEYVPGKCQKIYISYGRYDRSCDGCEKNLDVTFEEKEAKRFKISAQGSGDLGFIMTPIRGTFIN